MNSVIFDFFFDVDLLFQKSFLFRWKVVNERLSTWSFLLTNRSNLHLFSTRSGGWQKRLDDVPLFYTTYFSFVRESVTLSRFLLEYANPGSMIYVLMDPEKIRLYRSGPGPVAFLPVNSFEDAEAVISNVLRGRL